MKTRFFILLSFFILTSCATTVVRTGFPHPLSEDDQELMKFYPATIMDGSAIYIAVSPGLEEESILKSVWKRRVFLFIGGLIDMPFSLISDTVLLPYDIYIFLKRPNDNDDKIPKD
jgi:hypothetical protein